MTSDSESWLHGPVFARLVRGTPVSRHDAASRISAYIYGNILVLAALVPIPVADKSLGVVVVVVTALSTFVAHSFAEAVGESVRQGTALTAAERWAELRNSVPILSSAVLPSIILACGWIGWLEPRTAQVLAEIAILLRIGGIVFVIGRLRGERPNAATMWGAVVLGVAAIMVVALKLVLTH
ncbi:MAG TPA: hypothetical protein VIW24_17060 [Aldersonia sp.]